MAEIRSQDKRDKLRLLFEQCQPNGKSLKDLLMEVLRHCDDAINGVTPGTWIASTSENGGSASFMALQEFSPIVAKRLVGELLDAYDQAVECLERRLQRKPNDQEIYKRLMTHNLRSIRRYRNDYTALRYGVGFHKE